MSIFRRQPELPKFCIHFRWATAMGKGPWHVVSHDADTPEPEPVLYALNEARAYVKANREEGNTDYRIVVEDLDSDIEPEYYDADKDYLWDTAEPATALIADNAPALAAPIVLESAGMGMIEIAGQVDLYDEMVADIDDPTALDEATDFQLAVEIETARRLTACYNFLEGVPTAVLETTTLQALVMMMASLMEDKVK